MKCLASWFLSVSSLVLLIPEQVKAASQPQSIEIITIPYEPFVTPYNDLMKGKVAYKGFIFDLLESMNLSVPYNVAVLTNGETMEDLLHKVKNQEADLAAAPFIRSIHREDHVDFTDTILEGEAILVMKSRDHHLPPYINSLRDVLHTEGIEFGFTNGSLAEEILDEQNTDPLAQEARVKVSSGQYTFRNSNIEHVEYARENEFYAFFANKISMDYFLRGDCDLVSYDTGLHELEYAFAIQNQGALRDVVNKALHFAHENGVIDRLYKKWWVDVTCDSASAIAGSVTLLLVVNFVHFLR